MIDNSEIRALFEPIRDYLNKNDVLLAEARIVVINFFLIPETEDKIRQIADRLVTAIPDMKDPLDRTREVLITILTERAREFIMLKNDAAGNDSLEEIVEELSNYSWDTDLDEQYDDIQYDD